MIQSPQELIATLKNQHRILQSDLLRAVNHLVPPVDVIKAKDIVGDLEKFQKDLVEHLELENGVFYPDYLDRKVKRGEDVESLKKFIDEMIGIGNAVTAFLEKYQQEDTISGSSNSFQAELHQVIATLNTRIETEEEGIYDIYLAM